jgi:hypothetical protein
MIEQAKQIKHDAQIEGKTIGQKETKFPQGNKSGCYTFSCHACAHPAFRHANFTEKWTVSFMRPEREWLVKHD